ncbi:MAG: protoporphyrinogen oxidase [Ignavibacteriae bacterium]|nr:protoporphyrinogen oxidase [Ignavibacteriota bacterium]NOG97998.1 protoporphyrinogen oxidase [Ignavibacteriota bacterium]
MDKKKTWVTILGAGISGLAAAHWLNKAGYDVKILEANSEPGGAMITSKEEGFLIDYGPNSGLETTPLISQLAEEVGIKDKMIYANEEADKRYILRGGKLHELPTGGPAFFKTKLFSPKAKLRLMAEPFIGKSEDGYYQSMSEFVTRRLGKEFLDYAINPFVSGVFAGDPDKLSVKSAFPKLYRLEELYGGLIKGMIRGARERKRSKEESKQSAKMFSFIDGMQTFPQAIANKLHDKIVYNSKVEKVEKNESGYSIYYNVDGITNELKSDIVLSTIPAYITSKIFESIDPKLGSHLNEIYYPKVMLLYLGFRKSDIGRPLDGFGYLIPTLEKRKLLGAIWSSTIFPNRADEDYASFTIFVGGAQAAHLFDMDKSELINIVIDEFKDIMTTKYDPVFIKDMVWEKAIPQYNVGYIEHERYCDEFEKNNPGIFLSGNYRGGISVGDCVKNSDLVFKKIDEFVEKNN